MESRKAGPRRSDARRNREHILDVALVGLSRSAGVPLSAVAKKAGVGQGTLYRHSPSREALALGAYCHEVQQLTDSIHRTPLRSIYADEEIADDRIRSSGKR
ncbi:TetR family transcriptional regulator [Streptomyces sp. SID5643]|nr:TetR family transcriptional regulator [Streptomyces sp. SID5643]